MKITNLSGMQQSGLFLKVTLGGDYEEREEPGKGLVKKGKKGQVRARPSTRLSSRDARTRARARAPTAQPGSVPCVSACLILALATGLHDLALGQDRERWRALHQG